VINHCRIAVLPYCPIPLMPHPSDPSPQTLTFLGFGAMINPQGEPLPFMRFHPASWILHTPCAGFSKAGTRYRVPGIGYRLSGTWDLVPGTGAGPTPGAEHRAPKTEPGHWKTRTSGLHRFPSGARIDVKSLG